LPSFQEERNFGKRRKDCEIIACTAFRFLNIEGQVTFESICSVFKIFKKETRNNTHFKELSYAHVIENYEKGDLHQNKRAAL